MSTATIEQPRHRTSTGDRVVSAEPVVAFKRRTIDTVLIGFGVVATAAFAVAGGLLTWGHNFSSDYVGDELSSQNITFPSAEELTAEGRTDLVKFADQQLDTGAEAEAYASFINGHLAGHRRRRHLRRPRRHRERSQGRRDRSRRRRPDPGPDRRRCRPTPTPSAASATRLFKGETLRGLLLSAYAWSTVGMIAGIAAIGAFIAAGLMAVLVALGFVHHRRTPKTA